MIDTLGRLVSPAQSSGGVISPGFGPVKVPSQLAGTCKERGAEGPCAPSTSLRPHPAGSGSGVGRQPGGWRRGTGAPTDHASSAGATGWACCCSPPSGHQVSPPAPARQAWLSVFQGRARRTLPVAVVCAATAVFAPAAG